MMKCALVCGAFIGLYLRLYRSVFDCIGLELVNVLASVLSRIEKKACIKLYLVSIGTCHYFIHTKYPRNTCQYMMVFIGTYCNTYQYVYDEFGMCYSMYCSMY